MILSRRDPAPCIRSRAGWALRRPGTRGATVAPAWLATVRRARTPPIALPSASVGVPCGTGATASDKVAATDVSQIQSSNLFGTQISGEDGATFWLRNFVATVSISRIVITMFFFEAQSR